MYYQGAEKGNTLSLFFSPSISLCVHFLAHSFLSFTVDGSHTPLLLIHPPTFTELVSLGKSDGLERKGL